MDVCLFVYYLFPGRKHKTVIIVGTSGSYTSGNKRTLYISIQLELSDHVSIFFLLLFKKYQQR